MNEDFLAYVWKFQYFDKTNLTTGYGEPLAILRTGFQNFNAGPDFLDASIIVGELTWAGAVEIHVNASDWQKHQHTTDLKYDQVILHVVWENDMPITRTNGSGIPVLELKELVSPNLLQTYQQLTKAKPTIPCQPFLPEINELTKTAMVERSLLDRLESKAERVREIYRTTNKNWEAAAYEILLAGFGFKINQPGFKKLAKVLPVKVLQKHRHQVFQTEALLFGQAGFLTAEFEDDYLRKLQKEYAFLKHKFNLPEPLLRSDWNFLRLRPANFPTVRLAQLAALFSAHEHWFSSFLTHKTIKQFLEFFNQKPTEYWQTHYLPGREGNFNVGSLGKSSIYSLLINVVAPLIVAYARETDQPEFIEKALSLLEQLPAERNSILTMYENLGFENRSAAQSQGLLWLNQAYCRPVNCLYCTIGNKVLKKSKTA